MANILGIKLSEKHPAAAIQQAREFMNGDRFRYVVTPNPEIILATSRDEELFYILNKADLAIADGFGLKLAGWILGVPVPRLTGADLTFSLLEEAARSGHKTAILNWRDGLSSAETIQEALSQKYPGLNHLVLSLERSERLPADAKAALLAFAPALVFCTFGSPAQEKMIYHELSRLPSVRLAAGVGGTFDFLTGRIKRAPRWLRSIGLEWLWRLIKQPRRWRRIYNATIIFTLKIIRARLINRFLYRANVCCLLYKQEGGARKILIVEREEQPGHWQLPQGGTDGEDLVTAGTRELKEELGATNIRVRGAFKNAYRYDFGKRWGEVSNPSAIRSRRHAYDYRGQKQGLLIAEHLGPDSDIRIMFWDHRAWKWVDENDLLATVHKTRREGAIIFLQKLKSLNL